MKEMEEQNLEYIKEELGSLGFRNIPEAEIIWNLKRDPDKFQVEGNMRLPRTGQTEEVSYRVFFKKYERQDMYHAYAYEVTLKDHPEKTRLFGISFNNDFSLPEAFNLLNGRAVHKLILDAKTNKLSSVWFQMDFHARDVHGNYKLDAIKTNDRDYLIGPLLNKYPIREMQDPNSRSALVTSLYQGNSERVTLLKDGKEIRACVQACPRENRIDIRDAGNKTLSLDRGVRQRTAGKIMENIPGRRKRKGRAF